MKIEKKTIGMGLFELFIDGGKVGEVKRLSGRRGYLAISFVDRRATPHPSAVAAQEMLIAKHEVRA